jgi:hypothetical protein
MSGVTYEKPSMYYHTTSDRISIQLLPDVVDRSSRKLDFANNSDEEHETIQSLLLLSQSNFICTHVNTSGYSNFKKYISKKHKGKIHGGPGSYMKLCSHEWNRLSYDEKKEWSDKKTRDLKNPTKGPLQNSFSDYVKNASLTYI